MRKILENSKWNWDGGNGKGIQIKFTEYLTCVWHWVTIVNCIICPQFLLFFVFKPFVLSLCSFSYQRWVYFQALRMLGLPCGLLELLRH